MLERLISTKSRVLVHKAITPFGEIKLISIKVAYALHIIIFAPLCLTLLSLNNSSHNTPVQCTTLWQEIA